jgi:hypothetical protein
MLGLARHAQLAGWGTIPPGLKDTITFTTAASNSVYPRYYADFTNMTNRPTFGVVRQSYVDSSATIDMTGVTNNYKKAVMACTFKVGTNWLSTSWTVDEYQGGFNDYHVFNGLQIGPSIIGSWNYAGGGAMSYKVGVGPFSQIQITPATFATYRNKWLTIISATSDSTSDFANWTGTGTNTYGYCERIYLVEADTGVVLQQQDSYAVDNYFSADLSQSWQLNTGSYNYEQYLYLYSEDGTNFKNNNNDMDHLSSWAAFGQTFDPATYYTELLGVGIADTVAGVQAWSNLYYASLGTEPNSYTRELVLSNGDRLPTVKVDLLTNSTTPGVKPVWTLLSNNEVTVTPTIYYETFTSNGSWTAPNNIGIISALIVAGGGGGGMSTYQSSTNPGGGGGAGGALVDIDVLANVAGGTTYTIVVGTGGAINANGTASSAFGLTAIGGGHGGSRTGSSDYIAGASGGSGGGTAQYNGTAGTGTSSQGNNGGPQTFNSAGYSGGGGGAGGAGIGSSTTGNCGGAGISSSISGNITTYSQGGNCQSYNGISYDAAGSVNTTYGSGGLGAFEGGGGTTRSTVGLSGIVIIKYRLKA